jgi:hypothetical protein
MAPDQVSPEPDAAAIAPAPISGLAAAFGVYFQPRQTFERQREKPQFLIGLILIIVVQMVLSVLLFRSGVIANDAIAKLEAQGKPPEAIEATQKFFDSPAAPIIGAVSAAVVIPFVLLVISGVMFFMGNLMLGARLRFVHYLCAAVAGGVVGLVGQMVRTAIGLSKGTMDIRLGAGNLLGDNMGYWGRVLDTMTDPLTLWTVAISALGVSVFAKKGFGFGVLVVLPGFILSMFLAGMR